MTNFIRTLATFCLGVQALVSTADGTSSQPVRPPLGTRAGFLIKDPSSIESPSFSRPRVSAGIRSACARERAFTWNKERAGASAATRLRGGSWGSTPFVPQVLADADKPPEQPTASNSLDSCVSRRQYDHNHEGSQYVVAKESVLDDTDPEDLSADLGTDGRSGNRNDVGGGGGGARAGVLPSLPRTLPSGKTAVHKKFAWVP